MLAKDLTQNLHYVLRTIKGDKAYTQLFADFLELLYMLLISISIRSAESFAISI